MAGLLEGILEAGGVFSWLRALVTVVLVFFAPGFAWVLVLFGSKTLTILERLALSFGLSIALVTLSILALNRLVGMRITGLNSLLVILAITLIPLLYYGGKRFIKGKDGRE